MELDQERTVKVVLFFLLFCSIFSGARGRLYYPIYYLSPHFPNSEEKSYSDIHNFTADCGTISEVVTCLHVFFLIPESLFALLRERKQKRRQNARLPN